MLRDQYSGALSINSPLFEIKAQSRWWLPRSLTQSCTITLKPNTKAQRPKHDIYRMQPVYMCHRNGILSWTSTCSLNLIPTLFNFIPAAKYLDAFIPTDESIVIWKIIHVFLSFPLNLTYFSFVLICYLLFLQAVKYLDAGSLHTDRGTAPYNTESFLSDPGPIIVYPSQWLTN